MKITTDEEYQKVINKFKTQLLEKIPAKEKPKVFFTPPADPTAALQYGNGAVILNLITKSSGHDQYLIYVDHNGYGKFIRNIVR